MRVELLSLWVGGFRQVRPDAKPPGMRNRCGKEACEYSRGGPPRATKSATWRTGRKPPAARLIEADPGRNGDVQAAHLAEHGDANQAVTAFTSEPPHPFAFPPEDPRYRFRQVDREEVVRPVVGGP